MRPEQLKASILQYAVQGKLVEQRADEGTADELYQQIQKEKQRLIKDKKIKKEKPLVEITEDDIPFDIPESWKWVRLRTIVFNHGQVTPAERFSYIDIGSIDNKNQCLNKNENVIDADKAPCRARKVVEMGDILYSTVRPYLHNMCIIDRKFTFKPIASTGFAVMTCVSGVYNRFLFYYLMSPTFDSYANDTKNSKGVAYPAINDDRLYKAVIALPPLAEQKRIVARIEEILPIVGRYAAAYEKLEKFNAKFPDDMKKSILRYAVQGKLVEQRADEGTGDELYQQIMKEKQQLIKAKKIKNEKLLAEITVDEIPFDIPESWKWVKLSQIATLENGDRSNKYPVNKDYVDFGIPFFGAKDMNGSVMSFDNVRYISEEKFSELGNGKLKDKDIICLLRGSSAGKCAVFVADKKHHTGFICAQMVIIRCVNVAVNDYLEIFFSSPLYQRYFDSKVTGTAVRQLPAKDLGGVLIPLPPLAEQKRIVAKIEQLLPYCDRLEKINKQSAMH